MSGTVAVGHRMQLPWNPDPAGASAQGEMPVPYAHKCEEQGCSGQEAGEGTEQL